MDNEAESKTESNQLPLLMEYVSNQTWALEYNTLQQFKNIIERHISGVKLSSEEIVAVTKQDQKKDEQKYQITADGKAIIPVTGVIAKYSRMVNGVSSPKGTSLDTLNYQLADAVDNNSVNTIFLLIESPGGSISGLADFANKVYEAGQTKPVVAYADDLAASAAYWIGSQADSFYASQTADIGSIGVYTLMLDTSERAKQLGLKFVIVRSGPNKGIGADGIEITNDNIQTIQDVVDGKYKLFFDAIVRGRGMKGLDAEALGPLADGRLFDVKAALENKLIDDIMPLSQALSTDYTIRDNSSIFTNVNNNVTEYSKMKNETKTDEQNKAEQDEIIKSAANSERERITAIMTALPGDDMQEARTKAIDGLMTVVEAKAMAFDGLKTSNEKIVKALTEKLTGAEDKLKAIESSGYDVPAQATVDGDDGITADVADANVYDAAVKSFIDEGNKPSRAYQLAAKHFPEAHNAWKAAHPSTIR